MQSDFSKKGIPGILEPLTAGEEARVDGLLATAKPYIIPLRHQTPIENGKRYTNWTSVAHFRALAPQDRALLIRWALLHQREAEDFGALHRSLRTFSGLSSSALGEKFHRHPERIIMAEHGNVPFSSSYLQQFFTENPCGLPEDRTGHVHPRLRQSLEEHFQLTSKSCHRGALFADLAKQIEAYRQGEIPFSALPTQFDAYGLLKPGKESWRTLSTTFFPDKSSEYLGQMLYAGCVSPEVHSALQGHFGLNDHQKSIIARLPRQTQNKFAFMEAQRGEMTRPQVQRVFRHPERYPHAGAWLVALIDSAEQTNQSIGDKLNKSHELVRHYSDGGTKISNAAIAAFLRDRDDTVTGKAEDFNPLNLPADEKAGVIDPAVKHRFTELARGFDMHVPPYLSADMASRLLGNAYVTRLFAKEIKQVIATSGGCIDEKIAAFMPEEAQRRHSAITALEAQAKQDGLCGQGMLIMDCGTSSLRDTAHTRSLPVKASYDVDGKLYLEAKSFLGAVLLGTRKTPSAPMLDAPPPAYAASR